MKKMIMSVVVALFLATSMITAEVLTRNNVGSSSITSAITINKAQFNDSNELVGYKGFSLGYLGYHSKTYKNPVEIGKLNHFTVWGTGLLIFPYYGWGIDYYFNKSFSIQGSLNTGLWIIPLPTWGLTVHF